MPDTHSVEYTDTFGDTANYSWVQRYSVTVPELTHYGYDGGTGYTRAHKVQRRELMRRAKALCGLTGARGSVCDYGDTIDFRPRGMRTVMFVTFAE